jgi:hypothetical protein
MTSNPEKYGIGEEESSFASRTRVPYPPDKFSNAMMSGVTVISEDYRLNYSWDYDLTTNRKL